MTQNLRRENITVSDLIDLIRSNIVALLSGPVVAGLVALAVVSLLPRTYTSLAYLQLTGPEATAADSMMRSTPLIDKVLTKITVEGTTAAARRQLLDGERRLFIIPKSLPEVAIVFRMEVADRDPTRARAINTAFIDAWLEATNRLSPKERSVVVMGQPTLPEEPNYPNKGVIVVLAAVLTEILIVIVLLFGTARRFARPAEVFPPEPALTS